MRHFRNMSTFCIEVGISNRSLYFIFDDVKGSREICICVFAEHNAS